MLLIRARIAARWTQRQLADHLGLKEQQVQRYESSRYRGVAVERIAEVAAALGVQITAQATAVADRAATRAEALATVESALEIAIRTLPDMQRRLVRVVLAPLDDAKIAEESATPVDEVRDAIGAGLIAVGKEVSRDSGSWRPSDEEASSPSRSATLPPRPELRARREIGFGIRQLRW